MTQDILSFESYYLVGIKGVAMSSLASCLSDVGKQVAGSDVATDFVTKNVLDQLELPQIDDFSAKLPPAVDCLIYTSAHQASANPQVKEALERGIAVFTQAEAVANLANRHQTIAVCGVGGKSTISAMISWILEKTGHHPSYSVGVGEIVGLGRNGAYRPGSKHFVVEADEYVTDPVAAQNGHHTPRFSFLEPDLLVVSQIRFDHPDVYRDLDHTQEVYREFLAKLPTKAPLIVNGDDQLTLELASQVADQNDLRLISYGLTSDSDWQLGEVKLDGQVQKAKVSHPGGEVEIELRLPGTYNLLNGLSALAACVELGVEPREAAAALATFASTKRRAEYLGKHQGVDYYDDYAHHPSEVAAITQAFLKWLPGRRLVFAFQPHTYSRTKSLLDDFVKVLSQVPELVVLDIFASAREKMDESISSQQLVELINQNRTNGSDWPEARHLPDVTALHQFCLDELKAGDVLITLGAGDIYLLSERLELQS